MVWRVVEHFMIGQNDKDYANKSWYLLLWTHGFGHVGHMFMNIMLFESLAKGEVLSDLKYVDVVDNQSQMLHFLRKRIPCQCLDTMYQKIRGVIPRTPRCSNENCRAFILWAFAHNGHDHTDYNPSLFAMIASDIWFKWVKQPLKSNLEKGVLFSSPLWDLAKSFVDDCTIKCLQKIITWELREGRGFIIFINFNPSVRVMMADVTELRRTGYIADFLWREIRYYYWLQRHRQNQRMDLYHHPDLYPQ